MPFTERIITLWSRCAPIRIVEAVPDPDRSREAELFLGLNRERARHGLPPFRRHPLLDRAARAYAQRMARDRFFAHVAPEGDGPADRVEQAGYRPYSRIGENIACGMPTAAQTVSAWLNSPTHRALMLSPEMTDVGLGHSAARGVPYWVMECGRLRAAR